MSDGTEDQQPIGVKYALTFLPDGGQPLGELHTITVLDLAFNTCCRVISGEEMRLPHMKEVGKLRIMYVIKERWVGNYGVYSFGRNVS